MSWRKRPKATPKQSRTHHHILNKGTTQPQHTHRVGTGIEEPPSINIPRTPKHPNTPIQSKEILPTQQAPTAKLESQIYSRTLQRKSQPSSEVIAQWAKEWSDIGKAQHIDEIFEQYGGDKALIEKLILSGEIERAITTPLSEKIVPPIVNTGTSFYADAIVGSWFTLLEHYNSGEAYNLLKNWANDMIAQNGKEAFADMLQQGTADGNILTWEVVYKTGEAERYISNMLDYLPDTSQLYKDEVTDKFDYYRAMTDAMEQNEDWEEPE